MLFSIVDFYGKTNRALFVYVKAEGRKKFEVVKVLGADDGVIYFIDITNPMLPEALTPSSLTAAQRSMIYQIANCECTPNVAPDPNDQLYVLNMQELFSDELCYEWHAKIDVSLNATNASTHWQHIG